MSDRANIVVARRIQPSQPSPKTGTPVDFSPLDYARWRASRYTYSLPGCGEARGKRRSDLMQLLLALELEQRKYKSGGDALRRGRKSEFSPDQTLKQICRELLMIFQADEVYHTPYLSAADVSLAALALIIMYGASVLGDAIIAFFAPLIHLLNYFVF